MAALLSSISQSALASFHLHSHLALLMYGRVAKCGVCCVSVLCVLLAIETGASPPLGMHNLKIP